MADNPKTGKPDAKPGFPGSFADIFFGLAKGAISVFNPPADVTPIDVLRSSPAWHDPNALQRARDRLEERAGRTLKNLPPKQLRSVTADTNKLFSQIDAQLAILRAQPRWADVPEPDFSSSPIDQQTSPIFGTPGFGGPILGIGAAGGMTAAQKEILFRGTVFAKKIGAAMNRAQVAAKIAKLPSVSFEKVIGIAGEVLKKVPKGLLPDAELVGLVKQLGKALKGGKFAVIGLAGQKLGELAIEKAAAIAQRMNDERATKILGPMNSKDWNARKVISRSHPGGPMSRGRPAVAGAQKAAEKAIEPVRPKVPQNTGSPNQHPGASAKPPKIPKISQPNPVTNPQTTKPARAIKARRPSKVFVPKPVTIPVIRGPLRTVLLELQKLENFRKLAQPYYDLFKRRTTNPPKFDYGEPGTDFGDPMPSTGTQNFFSETRQATGTTAGCYTVCRKKSTGKKKRRKPRICISPSKASRLGII